MAELKGMAERAACQERSALAVAALLGHGARGALAAKLRGDAAGALQQAAAVRCEAHGGRIAGAASCTAASACAVVRARLRRKIASVLWSWAGTSSRRSEAQQVDAVAA